MHELWGDVGDREECHREFYKRVTDIDFEEKCSPLFLIFTKFKDNRAVQTIVGTSTYSIWMGLYCFGNDVTKCLWDDASGSSELYDNFLSAYPQIETGKCVVYSLQSSMVGRWYSADCQNETRAFVCELPTSYAGSNSFKFLTFFQNFSSKVLIFRISFSSE